MGDATGYVRVKQILKEIVPVCPSTWWLWVKQGKAPQPIRLGGGITVWRRQDVLAFLESWQGGKAA